ncbi:thiamine-binding protein [Brachybacterium endophyticum]|uniref:thiamine-binding protein n=1 Tax=Brachybacterium endophyticum TaxID=2182385 RepID=UPI001F0BCF9A|nr:thiamine-binding protein [Brachybacterium endophyticum]
MEQRFVLARVPRSGGRTTTTHTEIEGEWDEVLDVVKRATQAAGRYGSRVSLVLKADIRPGHEGELDGKIERLDDALDRR